MTVNKLREIYESFHSVGFCTDRFNLFKYKTFGNHTNLSVAFKNSCEIDLTSVPEHEKTANKVYFISVNNIQRLNLQKNTFQNRIYCIINTMHKCIVKDQYGFAKKKKKITKSFMYRRSMTYYSNNSTILYIL